ncbi:unnamed protein product, partial [Brassica rapa]
GLKSRTVFARCLIMGVAGSKPEGERYFGFENFGSVLQALYFCAPFRE